jgi:EAL domain-containing protein (putative c-di-GMP-specific phosphodiesterase class I)
VKQLKIDRFFIDGLDNPGAEGYAIVAAIIELAHSLKMVVVAEGVETGTQLAQLKKLRCDELQGFLLARPLDSGDFEELLRRPLHSKKKAEADAEERRHSSRSWIFSPAE